MESEGWTEKQKTLLADVGNSDEKFRFAIEASLKNVLNNLLVESFEDLKKAIDYLRKNDLGKASFYILGLSENGKKTIFDKIQDYRRKSKIKKIARENSFIGWADSFIQSDERWKPFFYKILNNTAIAENLDSALELSKKYSGFNFTTLNGDFVHESGLIDAGSSPKLDDTLFGRKQLLENLKNEFPLYEINLLKLKEEIRETENNLEDINLKELSDQNRILINDLANVEKQIAQFEFEKNKASDEIEKARKEIQELAKYSNQTDNEIIGLSAELELEIAEKNKAEEILSQLESETKKAEGEYSDCLSAQNQLKLELERLHGQKKNLENTVGRAVASKDNIHKGIVKRDIDITNSQEEINSLIGDIDDKQFDLDELVEQKKKLSFVEEEISGNLRELKIKASEIEKKLLELRKERDKVSDEIHSSDIKVNEINLKIDNLKDHIKENYSLSLELKDFEDNENFNFTDTANEVQNYKQQVKSLGPINLLAYSEYEEEREVGFSFKAA